MKVLLAPLFFRSRFCKHCARAFYKKNPGGWIGIHEFEILPPLGSFEAGRGFVPDYTALLLFDEFVIDAEAADRLKNPGERVWLKDWTELLSMLQSEGALTTADVAAAGDANPHQRGWMLRRDMSDPQRWWQAMGYFDSLIHGAERLLGANAGEAKDLSWRFNPESCFGVPGADGEVHDLSVVLLEAAESETEAHRQLYGTALENLRTQLREVNSCLTACDQLGVAPFMWAPYRRYLEEKLDPSTATGSLPAEAAGRQFFRVAFPAYLPTSVRDFARLRSDRRIKGLRAEIQRASQGKEVLDPKYPQRILTEVLHLERRSARLRRIAGWIATAVGTIPVPGLGLAASAVAEGVVSRVEANQREPWHWFYLISDGRGGT